jgi:hypothetical protein
MWQMTLLMPQRIAYRPLKVAARRWLGHVLQPRQRSRQPTVQPVRRAQTQQQSVGPVARRQPHSDLDGGPRIRGAYDPLEFGFGAVGSGRGSPQPSRFGALHARPSEPPDPRGPSQLDDAAGATPARPVQLNDLHAAVGQRPVRIQVGQHVEDRVDRRADLLAGDDQSRLVGAARAHESTTCSSSHAPHVASLRRPGSWSTVETVSTRPLATNARTWFASAPVRSATVRCAAR